MAYDVFISFKNTDEFGNKTKDVEIAEELYKTLANNDIRVFFSKIILIEHGAAAYKNAIETALDEAKVLVVISTSKEYLDSEWVSYERESFHNDILSGRKTDACIVPYLKNIYGSDVPRSLRNYQTFQIDDSSVSEVASFIKKFLDTKKAQVLQEENNQDVSLSTGKHTSSYSASTKAELKRLKIQAKNTHEADMNAINYVLNNLKKKEQLRILDMGCAYGYVTKDRFAEVNHEIVLGIDRDMELINYAKENSSFEHAYYERFDLESVDFEEEMEALMAKYKIEEFDIIFASLVIHHLKNPNKLLRRIRKYLSKDGYIIIRGSDDGSIMTYNDDGLIEKILNIHLNADGISDRANGRKIYSQLVSSGYKNVIMKNYIKDLSGLDLDERYEIFLERFSYRKKYLQNLYEKDPYNMTNKKNYDDICFYLNELENKFDDEAFWYCEIDFIGIAQKK